ncbi:unnamed protein product, partial [marine sediment metagenome]
MAQQEFNIDLQSSIVPMLSKEQKRTVINPSPGEKPEPPGIAYLHNVMPTKQGYTSVGFNTLIAAATDPTSLFETVRIIYGDERGRIHLAWDDTGRMYALRPGETTWLNLPDTTPATAQASFGATEGVTVGTVNGISYICYGGEAEIIDPSKVWTYNEGDDDLDVVSLPALDLDDVIGITSS